MADNVNLPLTGSGDSTKIVRTKDHTGVETQIVALDLNPAGAESLMAGAMPVTDNGGNLSVDDGGGSLTVDGTVAATQSGTWTVQPGNTANTTAWKVDGSAVTQPVSIASLPALAAGTNAIGKLAANSGVDIGDVTVDNAAGTNPVPVQGNVAHDGAAAGNPVLLAGQYKASPAKVSTDGDVATLAVTQAGKLLFPAWTSSSDTINDNNNYSSAQTNAALTNATAPGANKRLVIVEIMYSRDTAGNMKLVGDPAGTPATVFGPHYFPANGGMISTQCYIPLATNKALGITSVGGGNETITTRCIIENV